MNKPETVNRHEFLKQAGSCCAVALLCPLAGAAAGTPEPNPAETPLDKKMAFAQRWVKRFFDNLDTHVDETTRIRLMEAHGKGCFRYAHPVAEKPRRVEAFVRQIQGNIGEDNCRQDGNVVRFNYVQNRQGLRVADGYCLCPLVEKGPPGLSGTYCHCSIGYVREMFESNTGKQAQVELLESLKRGGNSCRFKITLS